MTTFDPDIDPDEITDDGDTSLWTDDTGSLTLGARRALVLLLKRHHIWAGRNPKEWAALLKWRHAITSRLNDVFLELVIDENYEVAYKRQAGREQPGRFTTLLHDSVYTREEAGVLLHIREVYLREMRAGNESAYVDRLGLNDELDYLRPPSTKDHKRADGYLDNAVKRLSGDSFLIPDKANPDRLRISPVIEVLLTVDRLNAFRGALYVEDADSADVVSETEVDDD